MYLCSIIQPHNQHHKMRIYETLMLNSYKGENCTSTKLTVKQAIELVEANQEYAFRFTKMEADRAVAMLIAECCGLYSIPISSTQVIAIGHEPM